MGVSPPPSAARRAELADFLRSRRAAIHPEDVGLEPGAGRRRTPGLRREEVAQRSGVGLSWYTWLEQGRDVTPSDQVLLALSRALELSDSEREHLFLLAGVAAPASVDGPVDDQTAALVQGLLPHLAFVLGPRFDVLAHNRAAALILGDLVAAPPERRNMLIWLFDNAGWDGDGWKGEAWERTARANLLDFRTEFARHPGDPAFVDLVARLQAASPLFRNWWERHDVQVFEPSHKRIVQRELGTLELLTGQSRPVHAVVAIADSRSGRRPYAGSGSRRTLSNRCHLHDDSERLAVGAMEHQTFGRQTGLRVSAYALGAGNFGTAWGTKATPAEAKRIFDRFAGAGGTFLDTADSYQNGQSESILGDLLATDRDHFTVATKYSSASGANTGILNTGNSRKNMVRAVEASLRRLKTDRIDLYWVHHPDSVTPIEEILRGLDDLVSSGKILCAGFSNFPAWRVARAAATAELRGWSPVAGVQIEYSLAERTGDREVLPMAEALGLGVALWSPLGGGLLTGKYRQSDAGRLTDWNYLVHIEDTAQKKAIVDEILAVAGELGVPAARVTMAWLLHRQARSTTALIPVIGPRTVEQLDDYLAALDVDLSPEQAERLDRVSAVAPGVPHQVAADGRAALLGGDADAFRPLAIPVA